MSEFKNKNIVTFKGVVIETLPSTLFRVKMNNTSESEGEGKEILAYLSGKMRIHGVRILVGDLVEVVLDPYGGKGRIVRRL
jgi:translation initiation factor IF-1